jgi:hypothetical protein
VLERIAFHSVYPFILYQTGWKYAAGVSAKIVKNVKYQEWVDVKEKELWKK